MPALDNSKHERFAQLVAGGATYTDAAQTVGYSEKRAASQGSVLAKNRKIAERIAELRERVADQAASSAGISKGWVLERLVENANRAMQAEAVRDKDGGTTGEYRYEGSVANKALELIGKELGMFVEKKEVLNTHQGTISLKLAAARQRLAQLSE
jgi:phage terminase small subunit